MEPAEQDNSITSALRDAISRIKRLEGQQHQLSLSDDMPVSASDSSKGSNHDHAASNTTATSSGSSRPTRPFLPIRRGAAASPFFFHTNNRAITPSSAPISLANTEEAVTHDFRQSVPPTKKARQARGNRVFIKPKETWTHDFCLLANPKDTRTPSLSTLVTLKEAGLGRKKVTFDDKRCGHGKVRQVLETVFPKLKSQCGSSEMLRVDKGGVNCNLKLIEMSPQGYNLQHLKQSVGATTIIYIRPMQSSLSMSNCISQTDDSIQSKCRYCLREIPLWDMKNHLENCMAGAGSSSTKDSMHEEELSDSSDEDDLVAKNAFPFSKFLQGQS
eukprot:gene20887-22938_t